jgi:predicted GIY-YIG superfamily endonuclease
MPNYQDTVIYKISCAGQNYVGHTTNYRKRCNAHKTNCINKKSELSLYKHIRANGGFDACEFSILEEYPCDTGEEARLREKYWVKEVNAALNIQTPGQTGAEYYATHKEQVSERMRGYNATHKEQIKQYQREYRLNKKKLKASSLPQKEQLVSSPTP